MMLDNPVLGWVMGLYAEMASQGLKVYKPNEVLAQMLTDTEMTVLAEDVRMPFASIAVLIPPVMQEMAPILISEEADKMYGTIPESQREEWNFPAPDVFHNLHARYLLIREEPPTVKWPRTITIGLAPVEFFNSDLTIVDAALVDPDSGKAVARVPSILFSPCPLIATRIPMFKDKTVEECFAQTRNINTRVAPLEGAEEDGLTMMFRLGLNAMMALSFTDHTEVPAEMPKVLKKSEAFRDQRKIVASEVRLDQSMLIGRAYAHGGGAPNDDGEDHEGDRSEMRPHWRRGHWRRFATGAGRKDRVWKWVPAIYVNKHRLLEAGFDEADTIVELKT